MDSFVKKKKVLLQLTCRLALADLDSAAAYFALYKLLQSAGTCLGENVTQLLPSEKKLKETVALTVSL